MSLVDIATLSPHVRAKVLRWRESARKYQLAQAARRAGSFTDAEWAAMLEYHGYRCAYCLRTDVKLERDHVIALYRGGQHSAENIVPACLKCNRGKKDRLVFYMVNR
jgi:5-methylcytosine-specific restriction endonuclease McrA